MLKFPLKEPILLIATSGKYICSVIYATNESVTIVDVHEQYNDKIDEESFTYLGDKIILDRENITGYKRLDADIGKKYVNWRAQYRRSQMKLVNGGKN